MTAWAHLHLPRLASNATPNVISLKVPGEKIDYFATVILTDAIFKVHEAGRQRCLRENVRNVHAWVVGDLCSSLKDEQMYINLPDLRKAIYDPWKGGAFVDAETLKPVYTARLAILSHKNVLYMP